MTLLSDHIHDVCLHWLLYFIRQMFWRTQTNNVNLIADKLVAKQTIDFLVLGIFGQDQWQDCSRPVCYPLLSYSLVLTRQSNPSSGHYELTMNYKSSSCLPLIALLLNWTSPDHILEPIQLNTLDSQLSQYASSILATASVAVAIDGLTEKVWRLNDIVALIHEDTHRVNKVSTCTYKI